ncbi:MAG TPA: FixH family protein [Rhodocyclaceae bacterium]|nr:FixH family protein [Rhodocyclaceae bacterium]
MNMNDSKMDIGPWYRQRWPWILISVPATSVVLGIVLLYFAITTADGLVVDDYYRQGRAIGQTMARSAHAAELGLAADLEFRADHLTVRLSAADGVSLPSTVLVTIAHPTRSGRDQSLALVGSDGEFSGALSPLSTGRWLVQLEDEARTWRLRRAIYLPSEAQVTILPYGS